MSAIDWPSELTPREMALDVFANTRTNKSVFTGVEKVTRVGAAAYWVGEMMLPPLDLAGVRLFNGTKAKLAGASGTFYIHPYGMASPANGGALGTPLVAVENGSGTTLKTSGWVAGQVVLNVGDYFEVGGEFKIVTETIISNASGVATLMFEPGLRNAPALNSPVIYANPKLKVRFANDTQGHKKLNQKRLMLGVSLKIVEAVYG